MILSEENILQTLFNTSHLNDISAEQLKQLAGNYPYYSAAHFLLAKKLLNTKQPDFKPALQKAAFHFLNQLWLHFVLNNKEETNEAINPINETKESIVVEETIAPQTDEIFNEPEAPIEDFAEERIINDKLSSMLQQHAADFEKPAEAAVGIPVEVTPYHRVDYFDSQGIKLEEEKANDKLGTQLKRFTDWLKQMKRINPNPTELANDEAGEKQVQDIAAHSNEAEKIVTEAMAEVLIKQGKPEDAVEIYQKLSFINPSKSAYFAAKIEKLKLRQ